MAAMGMASTLFGGQPIFPVSFRYATLNWWQLVVVLGWWWVLLGNHPLQKNARAVGNSRIAAPR